MLDGQRDENNLFSYAREKRSGMSETELHALIERIYEAALTPDIWPEVLQGISAMTGGVGGLILPVIGVQGSAVISSPNMQDSVAQYELGWWQHDSRNSAGRRRGVTSGVFGDEDFFTEAQMQRDPFYQDFLRPYGFGQFLCHLSVPNAGHLTSLSIQRDVKLGAFEQSHRRALGLIGPHVAKAVSISLKIRHAELVQSTFAATLDHLTKGIVLLDPSGLVKYFNRAAESQFCEELKIVRGRLQCRSADAQRALDGLTGRHKLLSKEPKFVTVIKSERRSTLLLQALPISGVSNDRLGSMFINDRGLLLLVHEIGTGTNTLSAIQHLCRLGLTSGQARVANAVGGGLSPREASERLGLAESTVRHVLKTVFSKLGISRQSELAILVSKLSSLL